IAGEAIKVAALPKLEKPLGPEFDGSWNVVISCKAVNGALPWENHFPARVKNGLIFGQRGVKGTEGSYTIAGRISPSGTAALTVVGLTGSSQYSRGNSPPGTPYSWVATARFHKAQGTGRRTDGLRECSLVFSKSDLTEPIQITQRRICD